MQSPNTAPAQEDMQQRIEQFAGQVVTDLAAAMAGVMTNLGHKLGLYRAMAEGGPTNSNELASRTATNERSVREWLTHRLPGATCDSTRTRISIHCLQNTHSSWRILKVPHSCHRHSMWRLRCGTVKTSSLPLSALAKEWAGTNTIAACSPEPRLSSAMDTGRI